MKRLLSTVLVLVLALTMVGCDANRITESNENALHLYYPTVLGSAAGDDAIDYVDVDWSYLPQDDKQAQIEAVLRMLLGDCEEKNFRSPIPNGTTVLNCETKGSVVYVDFSAAYSQLTGIDLAIANYCIALTLTQLSGIYAARIMVSGGQLSYWDTDLLLAGDVLLTSMEDVVRTLAVELFFPDREGTLVTEQRLLTLYEGESRVGVMVDALLEGPESEELLPLLPDGFVVLSVRLDNGLCYLNLSAENELLLPENREGQSSLLRGLVLSLCGLEGVEGVQILLDGEIAETFGQLSVSDIQIP